MDILTIAAALFAASAVAVLGLPGPGQVRLRAAVPAPNARSSPHGSRRTTAIDLSSAPARTTACLLAALAAATTTGGAGGAVVGAVVGALVWHTLRRLAPAVDLRRRQAVAAATPLAADLIRAAVAAGCSPLLAAETVGQALGGPLGRMLLDAVAASRVGTDPGRAWPANSDAAAARPLIRALTAAMTWGASPTLALERVAADVRETARWEAQARARSLGARAAAPLGLCFLPAFVLLGIVPVVATYGVMP